LLFVAAEARVSAQDAIAGQTLYSSNFDIDGIPRTCTFYIPLNYTKLDSIPLLIVLHDNNSDVKTLIKNYGDNSHAVADSIGAVVIYPAAVAQTWHDSVNSNMNDVGYISILIDYFVQRYQCNAAQVYIAGVGESASLALRFGCDVPRKVTAIATLLYAGKPACESFTVPFMLFESSNINGKISNAGMHEMWKFFLEQRKE